MNYTYKSLLIQPQIICLCYVMLYPFHTPQVVCSVAHHQELCSRGVHRDKIYSRKHMSLIKIS